jgi:hypothetical protein
MAEERRADDREVVEQAEPFSRSALGKLVQLDRPSEILRFRLGADMIAPMPPDRVPVHAELGANRFVARTTGA